MPVWTRLLGRRPNEVKATVYGAMVHNAGHACDPVTQGRVSVRDETVSSATARRPSAARSVLSGADTTVAIE